MTNILSFENRDKKLDYYNLFLQIEQLCSEDLRIHNFDLIGHSDDIDFGSIENKVHSETYGIIFNWEDWLNIVESTSQIVNLFITNSGFRKSFKGLSDEMLQLETNYFIECIDSVYWTIYLKHYDVGELKIPSLPGM